MLTGLTNVFTFLYSQVRKASLHFNEKGDTIRRNEAFLRSQLADPVSVEALDIKLYIMDIVLDELKTTTMASANKYVEKLLNYFDIVFFVFIGLMTLIMGVLLVYGFRYAKRNILDTNCVLRIIPYESLS